MATHTGLCAYLLVCVPVRYVAPSLKIKETLTRPLARASVPERLGATNSCASPVLPPTIPGWVSRPWSPKLCCTRISLCLSPRTPWDNSTATKEDATLQQAVSLKIRECPNWILVHEDHRKKEGNARKTRDQVALRTKFLQRSTLTRPPSLQMEDTSAANCDQGVVLDDLRGHNGDTKKIITVHAKETRRAPARRRSTTATPQVRTTRAKKTEESLPDAKNAR